MDYKIEFNLDDSEAKVYIREKGKWVLDEHIIPGTDMRISIQSDRVLMIIDRLNENDWPHMASYPASNTCIIYTAN